MNEKTYLILESGTGLMDGYYHGWERNAEGVAERWDETRPLFKHFAVEVVGDHPDDHHIGLRDHQMMNRYCHASAGGECRCFPGMDDSYRCRP